MTIHKIDREKLAEALQPLPQNRTVHDEIIITDAAENWLTITDPGFDLPYPMQKAGALTRDLDALHMSSAQRAVATFKSMIATMIKGE